MVDTLISFFVDTNWADPNSEEMVKWHPPPPNQFVAFQIQPYALFVDQPTLAFDPYYYSPEVFPIVSHQMEWGFGEIENEKRANILDELWTKF